jgi:hypothetical protein
LSPPFGPPPAYRLALIAGVFPIGSVECERRFSTMNLVATALRNRLLPEHLNVCVRIAASEHAYKTFDVVAAHKRWLDKKTRYLSCR